MENDFWQEDIHLPHNLQIEKLVLGSLLNDNLLYGQVQALKNSDFLMLFIENFLGKPLVRYRIIDQLIS